jgi:hypothetical protein
MLKSRWTLLAMGMAFSVALAVVVGHRLSGEAMAVVIGVMAGVVASIPTSLIVVWFASRPRVTRTPMDIPARPAPEPRILLMPAPQSAQASPAMTRLAAYGAQSYAGYAQGAAQPGQYAPEPVLMARHFTVIGGSELPGDIELADTGYAEEVVTWQR